MKSIFVTYVIVFSVFLSKGQTKNHELLRKYEDSLTNYGKVIVNGNNALERQIAIYHFRNILYRTLKTEGSFQYPFDSLIYISILKSNDDKFRIFNWFLLKDDNTYKHFAIIHFKTEKGYNLIELEDCSDNIYNPEDTVLTECWYGAHYYSLITCGKKKNSHYLLLGYDGNNSATNKKIIEVLSFKNEFPVFGGNVFKLKNEDSKTRWVFEYRKDVVMSLKYYPKKKMIIYDHLSPDNKDNEGFFMFYGPDMRYDGFKYKRGKWHVLEDLPLINEN